MDTQILVNGLRAVERLISESNGVDMLHLNGDAAPWGELLAGGQYENWLRDFSVAIEELDSHEAAG